MSNAIKYTIDGNIIFKASNNNNEVIFNIIDEGIGIPQDKLEEIFSNLQVQKPIKQQKFEKAFIPYAVTQLRISYHSLPSEWIEAYDTSIKELFDE